jgi:putative membrane protein
MFSTSKSAFATGLAAVMHAAGLFGTTLGWDGLFSRLTPFNLLTMLVLLIWTLPEKNRKIGFFFIAAFLAGMISETIGVHTGLLFGHYQYGDALGLKLFEVPLLIGVNWFVVVYAAGMCAQSFRQWLSTRWINSGKAAYSKWIGASVVLDGALIATAFDYLMEPGAVKLGFWSWNGGNIPPLNYLSWFGVSLLLLFFFQKLQFKTHPFAIHLLIIQAIFFLAVR